MPQRAKKEDERSLHKALCTYTPFSTNFGYLQEHPFIIESKIRIRKPINSSLGVLGGLGWARGLSLVSRARSGRVHWFPACSDTLEQSQSPIFFLCTSLNFIARAPLLLGLVEAEREIRSRFASFFRTGPNAGRVDFPSYNRLMCGAKSKSIDREALPLTAGCEICRNRT